MRKRIRRSNAQGKNKQSVLGIVPRLNRVIPAVEHLNERANQAGDQDDCDDYSRWPRSHGLEYSAAVSQGGKQKPRTKDTEPEAFLLQIGGVLRCQFSAIKPHVLKDE